MAMPDISWAVTVTFGMGSPFVYFVTSRFSAIHSWLLLFGMLPFFFFGFLMTTFPRWMAGHEIPVQRYVPAFVFMLGGVLLFHAGLYFGTVLLTLASASMLTGWAGGLYALWRVLRDTRPGDKRRP